MAIRVLDVLTSQIFGIPKRIPDYWLLLPEGHLRRRLFASMLRMIAVLPPAGRLAKQERG